MFFCSTNLTTVDLPNSLTTIGNLAFAHCANLTRVTIPNGIASIGDGAFCDCEGLTSVTIPESVNAIGIGAFECNFRLTAICVSTNNLAFSSAEGVLFNKSQSTLIQCPAGKVGSYHIPDGVTLIDREAFGCCGGLTNVTLPKGLRTIGMYGFLGCFGLSRIVIPETVTGIEFGAFSVLSTTTAICFQGNAPKADRVFSNPGGGPHIRLTVYYLPGTQGWETTFCGNPTAPWVLPHAVILATASNFGIQTKGFGFGISWATNASVVAEVSTSLANPVWVPVTTNTLVKGWSYFSDPEWQNHPIRFYRIRSR